MGKKSKQHIRISRDELVGIISDIVKSELYEKNRKPMMEIIGDMADLDIVFTKTDINPYLRQYGVGSINEGLIVSYDAETVQDIIRRKFCLPERQVIIKKVDDNGASTDIIVIVLNWSTSSEEIGEIRRTMRTCGYFESQSKMNFEKYMALVFEPRFANDVTKAVFDQCEFMYHATPSIFADRILQKGLEPRMKSTAFTYPSRVYMVRNLSQKSIELLKKIQNERGGKVLFDNNEYTILSIKIGKLSSNVRFFMDPIAPNSVYTYDNIPPKAIEVVSELK